MNLGGREPSKISCVSLEIKSLVHQWNTHSSVTITIASTIKSQREKAKTNRQPPAALGVFSQSEGATPGFLLSPVPALWPLPG